MRIPRCSAWYVEKADIQGNQLYQHSSIHFSSLTHFDLLRDWGGLWLNMRGVSSLAAVAAIISTVSGAIVPLHLVRAAESDALSSKTVQARASNDDDPLNWDLASYLADLTDALPTTILQQDSSTTVSSVAVIPLPTVSESPSNTIYASMATPSPELASSSKMTHDTSTATSAIITVIQTLTTSIRTFTPLPKPHTQSTRTNAPTPSYVSFNISRRCLNSDQSTQSNIPRRPFARDKILCCFFQQITRDLLAWWAGPQPTRSRVCSLR